MEIFTRGYYAENKERNTSWTVGDRISRATMGTITGDNRLLLVRFCDANDPYIQNTKRQGPPKVKCTLGGAETEMGPPWNSSRYAELDFIVSKQR